MSTGQSVTPTYLSGFGMRLRDCLWNAKAGDERCYCCCIPTARLTDMMPVSFFLWGEEENLEQSDVLYTFCLN